MWNNQCDIIGNLTRDPEVKTTSGGRSYAKFTVAVNRKADGKEYTDWVPVTAWGDMAEAAGNWLSKGMRVRISGRFTSSSYTDKNGQKRYANDITAEGIFVQVYKDGMGVHTMSGDSGGQQAAPQNTAAPAGQVTDFRQFGNSPAMEQTVFGDYAGGQRQGAGQGFYRSDDDIPF